MTLTQILIFKKDIESTKKKENLTEGNDENEEKKEEIYAKKK